MARFTKEKRARKRAHAKSLYIKGIDIDTISDITEVAVSTLKKWAVMDDYEKAKQGQTIAISELRQTILDSFIALKNGETPLITPDQAAKYASAFEKLSDKKKVLSYMYEAFEMLTDELLKDIQKIKTKAGRKKSLEILKVLRAKTDIILTKITAETLDN